MGRAITFNKLEEGEVFCKWLNSRLIINNKNVLGAELGPTGSGKSYRDLRKAELWYQYHFQEPFPTKNICFGVGSIMTLLSSGKLRKGEILIFEEAGANLGSLDFQNKVSKMFTYVLQSFRSMNVAIFFNLPYLSMLNKQARLLLHYSFESSGIDHSSKMNKCKPFFHQVNQSTGKIYQKYPIVKYGNKTTKIRRFNFSIPSQYLIDEYEIKKKDYLKELTTSFTEELKKEGFKKMKTIPRDIEFEAYKLYKMDMSITDIAKKLEKTRNTIYSFLEKVRNYTLLDKK